MRYDPDKHHRRSIRLPHYDYSQPGAYFVTICTKNHECILGDIVDGEMRLKEFGSLADECWRQTINHFPNVKSDVWVIMPNHMHCIVDMVDPDRRGGVTPPCGRPSAETTPLLATVLDVNSVNR